MERKDFDGLSVDVHPTIFAQSDRESDRFGIIRPKSDRFNSIHQSIRPKIVLRTRYNNLIMIFGKKIKELREERGLLQRQLSAALEIDTPMYSKIERGERKAKRSQIPIMAQLFEVEEKELLTIWLADKVLDTVEDASEVKNDAIAYVQNEIENG